jgi:raffinose/stachyose/melibiose transport system permease protein
VTGGAVELRTTSLLTTLPILILYAIGRRQLMSGLTAGFSK